MVDYNSFLVYCRELAPCTVSLTGDRAQGDDSKHDSHYKILHMLLIMFRPFTTVKVVFMKLSMIATSRCISRKCPYKHSKQYLHGSN